MYFVRELINMIKVDVTFLHLICVITFTYWQKLIWQQKSRLHVLQVWIKDIEVKTLVGHQNCSRIVKASFKFIKWPIYEFYLKPYIWDQIRHWCIQIDSLMYVTFMYINCLNMLNIYCSLMKASWKTDLLFKCVQMSSFVK
jgi:hypothetical protein